jgi:hypothetical protein
MNLTGERLGVMRHCKISNSDTQGPKQKTGLVRRRRIGHCDLFDFCDLLFGISMLPITSKQLAIFR